MWQKMKKFYWGKVKILSYLGHQLEYQLYLSLTELGKEMGKENFDTIRLSRFPFEAFGLFYL